MSRSSARRGTIRSMNRFRDLSAGFLAAVLIVLAGVHPATAAGHLCLWKVHGRTNTVFLLGSIHMLPADAYPLDPRIEAAFEASTEVVFEIDFGKAATAVQELEAQGTLPEGQTLRAMLPAPLRRRLHRELEHLGLGWGTVDRMKPWMAAMTISNLELERAGYDPSKGLDLVLYQRAIRNGKKTSQLETARQQIETLDHLTPRVQIELVEQTLHEISDLVPEVRRLTAMWRTGDARGLAATLAATFRDSPTLYTILVTRRNRAWLPRILRMTRQDHNVLVVVGTLHLVGTGGLVSLCRRAGLTVIQQ